MQKPGMPYRKLSGYYEMCQLALRSNNLAYHSCTVRSLACLLQAISGTTNLLVYTSNRVLQQITIVTACTSMLQLRCAEDWLACHKQHTHQASCYRHQSDACFQLRATLQRRVGDPCFEPPIHNKPHAPAEMAMHVSGLEP